MTRAGTQNFHVLGKIEILILLLQSHTFSGTTAAVINHGKNGSDYHCPSFSKVHLKWHEFHPFTHYNLSSKTLEGDLIRYIRKALNICCPTLQILEEKVDINSSCEMEIHIRQNTAFEPTVHFPIFANKGEEEQFERSFIELFDSPGPAVLKINQESSSSPNGLLYLLRDVWKLIVISLLHAVLAGMVIWAVVCISTNVILPVRSLYQWHSKEPNCVLF